MAPPHPLDPRTPSPGHSVELEGLSPDKSSQSTRFPSEEQTTPPLPSFASSTAPSSPSISRQLTPLTLLSRSSTPTTPPPVLLSSRSVHFDPRDLAGQPPTPSVALSRVPFYLSLSPRTPRPPSPFRVYVALVLAQLFWSGFHVLGKFTFTFLSPFVLPTFRSLGVIPIFAVYAYRQNPRFYVLTPRQHSLMILEGLLGNTLAQQFFNYGVQLSSASLAGMCQPSIPVMTTIIAIGLKREGVSAMKVVGIAVAIAGSLMMVLGAGEGASDGSSSNFPLGALMFLSQCLCTSVYIIVLKPMFSKGEMEVRAFTFYLFLYGGVGHVVFGAFFLPSVQWTALPLTLIPILLYTIVIATFAAWSLSVYATNHLPASVSSVGITLQSFFSPVLGAIFLGEAVTWLDGVGGIAIVVGIIVVVSAKARESQQHTKVKGKTLMEEVIKGKDTDARGEQVDGEKEEPISATGDSDDEAEDEEVAEWDKGYDKGEEDWDTETGTPAKDCT